MIKILDDRLRAPDETTRNSEENIDTIDGIFRNDEDDVLPIALDGKKMFSKLERLMIEHGLKRERPQQANENVPPGFDDHPTIGLDVERRNFTYTNPSTNNQQQNASMENHEETISAYVVHSPTIIVSEQNPIIMATHAEPQNFSHLFTHRRKFLCFISMVLCTATISFSLIALYSLRKYFNSHSSLAYTTNVTIPSASYSRKHSTYTFQPTSTPNTISGKKIPSGYPSFTSTPPTTLVPSPHVIWQQIGETIHGPEDEDLGMRLTLATTINNEEVVAARGFDTVFMYARTRNDINGNNNKNISLPSLQKMDESEWTKIMDLSPLISCDTSINWSVALTLSADGRYLVVGSSRCQAAHVFFHIGEEINSGWIRFGSTLNVTNFSEFSNSIDVDIATNGCNRLIIGSHGQSIFDPNYGHIEIYDYIDEKNDWVLNQRIDGIEIRGFGHSVSIDSKGMLIAVASYDETQKGSVFIYQVVDSMWLETQRIYGDSTSDGFGFSISLSANGTVLVIGAPNNSYAKIFEFCDLAKRFAIGYTNRSRSEPAFVPTENGFIKSVEGSRFGHSVSVSGDGTTVAIGAIYNDEDGWNRGKTFIFALSQDECSSHVKHISVLTGERESENFGRSVSLSYDGTRLAVGGSDSKVKIYQQM